MTAQTYDKQQRLLAAISIFIREHGYSPSLAELCEMADISSKSLVATHLERLAERGLVTYVPGQPRTVRLVKSA